MAFSPSTGDCAEVIGNRSRFSAPHLEEQVRYHQRIRLIQVLFQFRHQLAEFRFGDQLLLEDAIAHVFEKLIEDHAPVVAFRINVNQGDHFDISQAGLTKETVCSATDKEIDPTCGGVFPEDFKESIPGAKRGIAAVRQIIRLMAGDGAAWTSQADHLANDCLDVRHIH